MVSLIFILGVIGYSYLGYSIFENIYLIPVYVIVAAVLSFITLVLMLILITPIMKYTSYTNKFKLYIVKSIMRFANKILLGVDLKVIGKENMTKDNTMVLYANHKSYLDPIVIIDITNRPIGFTPKTGVYKIPIVGTWLKYLGSMPIDRSSDRNTARAMSKAVKDVKNGLMLAVFPEGGIKSRDDEKMVEMRAGAYKISMKAEADLLPVTIIGLTKVRKRVPFRRTKVKVIIHPVIKYEDVKELSTTEIADKVFNIINSEFEKHAN